MEDCGVKKQITDQETLLEVGLVVLGVVLMIGLIVLMLGRTVGGMQRRARHAKGPPAPGSLPPESRQGAIKVVPAR